MKKNGLEIEQKMEEETVLASFVGHGSPAMCFWVMEDEENLRSITRQGRNPRIPHPLPPSPPLTPTHPKMPTELPYAADAEDSLSYDELQVRLRPLRGGL